MANVGDGKHIDCTAGSVHTSCRGALLTWQRGRYIGASDEGKTPELFLFYPEQGFKYRLDTGFAFKEAKQFLLDYQAGKAKPYTKSEEVG